jgi:hypothetical protein
VERQLNKLAQQEEKIHVQMAASTNDGDFERLGDLNRQLKDLTDEKDALELEWLEASEVLGD